MKKDVGRSWKVFYFLFQKELRLYFLGTSFYLVSAVLSGGLFLLFRFTYPSEKLNQETSISILWAVHLISSLFSLIASAEWEWESNAMRAVKLSGAEGYFVFLSKSIASFFSLTLLWVLEIFVWLVLFGSENSSLLKSPLNQIFTAVVQMLLAGAVASAGISFLGQITSILALHSRFKHVLMFIVFFPVSIPLIIAASAYTRIAVSLKGLDGGFNFISLELAFCFFFLAAGFVLYDVLWEE
ncbi:MAG: heme exporter protein CcmB [Spirochaetia bacterium]|nr:heme exporter protein CcmB [Spirochaetia bacterium]